MRAALFAFLSVAAVPPPSKYDLTGGGDDSLLKTDDGAGSSDIMFWWDIAMTGPHHTLAAGERLSADASVNLSLSKFAGHSGRPAGPSARPIASFSPFQISYGVSTILDPTGGSIVRLRTPPPYQNQNMTQNFESLLPLRKVGPLIVPVAVDNFEDKCNPDTNSSCLAELVGLLTSPARRAAAVAEMVQVAKHEGYGGWNFDQESQMQSKSAVLTAGWRRFLTELAAAMKAADPAATVSVDICGNCGAAGDYMVRFVAPPFLATIFPFHYRSISLPCSVISAPGDNRTAFCVLPSGNELQRLGGDKR